MKYLGVILVVRLTWIPHIRYIADKATRATNIFKVIARVSWGANSAVYSLYIGTWSGPTWSGVPLYFAALTSRLFESWIAPSLALLGRLLGACGLLRPLCSYLRLVNRRFFSVGLFSRAGLF